MKQKQFLRLKTNNILIYKQIMFIFYVGTEKNCYLNYLLSISRFIFSYLC